MVEQTYMKLQDKVNRPKLSKEKVNRDNKEFKRVVDRYQRWCKDDGGYETRETYEDDIIKCLFEYDHDGYHLAEFLKEEGYIEPDSELVDILDGVSTIVHSLTNEIIGQWTKENFLEIPNNVIGKKVNANQNLKKYENYYINSIYPETYQVTISEKFDKKGGWVINFENVTFVE
jgi:hypothetical protein